MMAARGDKRVDAGAGRGAGNPSTPPLHGRTLRTGSRGERVRALQRRLEEFGFEPGPQDGVYGPLTFAAVRDLQRRLGLPADGVAGRRLLTALSDPRLMHMQRPLVVAELHPSLGLGAMERAAARYGPRWNAVATAFFDAARVVDAEADDASASDGGEGKPARPDSSELHFPRLQRWHVVHTRGAAGPGHYAPGLLQRLVHRRAYRRALTARALAPFSPEANSTSTDSTGRNVPLGLYFDLGGAAWGDGTALLQLLHRVGEAVRRRGGEFIVSILLEVGKPRPRLFRAVDAGAVAEAADLVVLVPPLSVSSSVDGKGRPGAAPRPPTPEELNRAVAAVTAEIPSWRCLLLLSLGALMVDVDGSGPSGAVPPPRRMAHREAVALAYRSGVRPRWDDAFGRRTFHLLRGDRPAAVWLEDRHSLGGKLAVASRRRLGGVYLHGVGLEDARIWSLFPRQGHVSPGSAI